MVFLCLIPLFCHLHTIKTSATHHSSAAAQGAAHAMMDLSNDADKKNAECSCRTSCQQVTLRTRLECGQSLAATRSEATSHTNTQLSRSDVLARNADDGCHAKRTELISATVCPHKRLAHTQHSPRRNAQTSGFNRTHGVTTHAHTLE